MPHHEEEDDDKPCRACSDFKTWAKKQSKNTLNPPPKQVPEKSKDCPLDKDELGRSTWGFLHSMAAYYPVKPSYEQQKEMTTFINLFSRFYPCEPCAIDFQEDIKKNPPNTCSRSDLSKWFCERHNTVNIKLGKPVFDCSKVDERWKDGWLDGSCD